LKAPTNEKVISFGIIILLVIQVAISLVVVRKINSLDEAIHVLGQSSRISNSIISQQSQIPGTSSSFIEDVSIDDDPWKGSEDAAVIIVEFGDYQCPACGYATGIIEEILNEYSGKVKFVYRDFPLEHSHPNAVIAAEAANCAGEQRMYWEMHDLLFANQLALDIDSLYDYAETLDIDLEQFRSCLENHKYKNEIDQDFLDGLRYEVNSTPTFFVNGYRVIGANEAELHSRIEGILGN
jgi:protein-disulfide isomerase